MRPLEGVVVVSLEQAVAAPLATRHLADLGARVIKVERRGMGDFARQYDTSVKGLSSYFVWLNRNKESMTLDIKKPAGFGVLRRLLEHADVFVHNLAPGALDRLGLGNADLAQRYPKMVACGISGYGSDGPMREKKAYDLLVQAETGLLDITGTESSPAKVGISVADIACGMYAFSGILASLYQRQRTGQGHVFEVSLFDAIVEWLGAPAYYTSYGGRRPARSGVAHATISPYGAFSTGDGRSVMFGIQNEREWKVFCDEVLDEPQLASDERFSTNSLRAINREALTDLIERSFADQTADAVIAELDRFGIANAEMRPMSDLLEHPQLRQRDRFFEVSTAEGPVWALRPPLPFIDVETTLGSVPELGEHTNDVLRSVGYHEGEIRQLAAEECI